MRVLILLFISLLFLYGCESASVRPDQEPIPPDARAEMLLNEKRFEQAANEYLSLAERYPDDTKEYQLRAAHAFIEANLPERARQLLEEIDLLPNEQILRFYHVVLQAKMLLTDHQPAEAIVLLALEIPDSTAPELIIALLETRAEAYELQGQITDAARDRIQLGSYLTDRVETADNASKIWNHLVTIDPGDLVKLRNSGDNYIGPWIELATISKSLMSKKEQLKQAIARWSMTYPEHSANISITSHILEMSERFNSQPAHIALLLPLSGMYERFSEKIRDGFMTAWFNETAYKPTIRLYNADSTNIKEVYQTAVDNGAEFIVGPLEKDAVRILTEQENLPVRILALNQLDQHEIDPTFSQRSRLIPDLIQYGLPPEDEARQVARRGLLEGANKALVITSADDYGDRVYNSFSQQWIAQGGKILEHIRYYPQTGDFISPVKELLNIDASEARINALRQRLGRTISATTRIRQDPDFIFMVASNLTARQIVPHLRFFRAESVPIYSVSLVYTGSPSPQTDKDLNGVEFVDIPWLLKKDTDANSLHFQISQGWQTASTLLPRYYAFGIDAFRLISRLGDLSSNQTYSYPGETGDLYMADNGIIHRDLVWAKFINGIPQRIEPRPIP